MELGIEVRREANVCVMTLTGEVDVYTAPRLKERLAEEVDGGCEHIVVDLAGVEFMDSSGLGALVSGLRRIKERDGTIRLASARDAIVKVFRITGLDKVFPMFEQVDDAL
jgi:anti-sigma B factor antagonist